MKWLVTCLGYALSMGKPTPVVNPHAVASGAQGRALYQQVKAATPAVLFEFHPQVTEQEVAQLAEFLAQPWTKHTAFTDSDLEGESEPSLYETKQSSPMRLGENVSRALHLLDEYSVGRGYGTLSASGKTAARRALAAYAAHAEDFAPAQASTLLHAMADDPKAYAADGIASGALMDKVLAKQPLSMGSSFYTNLVRFKGIAADSPTRPSPEALVSAYKQQIDVDTAHAKAGNVRVPIGTWFHNTDWLAQYFEDITTAPGVTREGARKAALLAAHFRQLQGGLATGRWPESRLLLQALALSQP